MKTAEIFPALLSRRTIIAEVNAYARKESQLAGRIISKGQLAREIFFWAWEAYKAAGSVAALKRVDVPSLFLGQEKTKHAGLARVICFPTVDCL